MGKARYQCNKCKQMTVMEVPRLEQAMSFAKKVPCSKCGTVDCTFRGSA